MRSLNHIKIVLQNLVFIVWNNVFTYFTSAGNFDALSFPGLMYSYHCFQEKILQRQYGSSKQVWPTSYGPTDCSSVTADVEKGLNACSALCSC